MSDRKRLPHRNSPKISCGVRLCHGGVVTCKRWRRQSAYSIAPRIGGSRATCVHHFRPCLDHDMVVTRRCLGANKSACVVRRRRQHDDGPRRVGATAAKRGLSPSRETTAGTSSCTEPMDERRHRRDVVQEYCSSLKTNKLKLSSGELRNEDEKLRNSGRIPCRSARRSHPMTPFFPQHIDRSPSYTLDQSRGKQHSSPEKWNGLLPLHVEYVTKK